MGWRPQADVIYMAEWEELMGGQSAGNAPLRGSARVAVGEWGRHYRHPLLDFGLLLSA